ncbi:beta-1 adrenergic receptor-like [Stylophora pistillata]|uniref:beta-1 adrenergic receptor-like n=1 Tax=Stylophora pistillata TaxID=50429 RepID=UPI000C03C0BE|nr:beta-1 adrenergic receptor-like [Stylophora pistillata]
MNELFCNKSSQYFPIYAELADLRSTLIANCVFNNCLTYTTIMLNIVTIYAIHKTSTIAKTLKTLLLSLACSDVAVGVFTHPLYTFFLVKCLQLENPACKTQQMLMISSSLFSVASFFGVVAVSVDRFLAVHLHLRYQELVTQRRVVIVVAGVWVFSASLSLLVLWGLVNTRALIITVSASFSFIMTCMVYIRIYLSVRRHRSHIQSMKIRDEARCDEMKNFAVLIKSTVGIFYVYLVFLSCYLPVVICTAVIRIYGSNSVLKRLYLFSLTLVYLNSSLNPVIYCWKMRHIRHAIMDILWKVSQRRNHPSRVIYNRPSSVVHVDN